MTIIISQFWVLSILCQKTYKDFQNLRLIFWSLTEKVEITYQNNELKKKVSAQVSCAPQIYLKIIATVKKLQNLSTFFWFSSEENMEQSQAKWQASMLPAKPKLTVAVDSSCNNTQFS